MDDRPPALVDPVTIGPYRAGRAHATITLVDRRLAAELDAALVDLRSATNGDPTTRFVVVHRGPGWLSHGWGVWRNGEPCETSVAESYIRTYLVWEITRLAIETAPPLVPVHAAALVRNDVGIVLTGSSGAGKSTAAGWLTHRGWGFLTDEVTLLDERSGSGWWVEPFPRPIGVRRPGPLDELLDHPDGDDVAVPASRLGSIGDAAPLSAIVAIDRFAHDLDEPEVIMPATALDTLATHLACPREGSRTAFRALARLALAVPLFRVGTADLERAEQHLEHLVGALA